MNVAGEPTGDDLRDELSVLVGLVDELTDQLDVWDPRLDPTSRAGESPEAEENRAIVGAQASLARRRARELRAPLSRLRERTVAMRAQAERPVAPPPRSRDHRTDADREQLTDVLASMARQLIGPETVEDTLDRAVAAALRAIPDVERAGVSLLHGRRHVESRAPSDDVVKELDRLQAELDEGPCIDAARTQDRVLAPDLDDHAPWPRFASAAVGCGVRTVVAFPLFGRHGAAGALNLYADTPGVLGGDSLELGELFASHVSLALHGASRVAGLNQAVSSRDVIGQAKGILMERFDLDATRAFDLLVRSSQDTNMKLVDVARWLVGEKTGGA